MKKIANLDQEFIGLAEENNGVFELDLRIPAHYEYYMSVMGGEELIEKKCPAFFTHLKKIRMEKINGNVSKAKTEAAKQGNIDTIYLEYTDIVKSESAADTNEPTLYGIPQTSLVASYLEKRAGVFAKTAIYDENGDLVHTQDLEYENTKMFRKSISGGKIYKTPDKRHMLVSRGIVTEAVQLDGNLVVKPKVVTSKTYIQEGINEVVTNFTVSDPEIKNPGRKDYNDKVLVSYLRDFVVPYSDYAIDNAPVGYKIKMVLPVSITVTVDKKYQIQGLDENEGYRMYFNHNKGGMVPCLVLIDDIKKKISNADGGVNNRITIELPDFYDKKLNKNLPADWNNSLDFTEFKERISETDIYGSFSILYGVGPKTEAAFTILFNSTMEQETSKSMKKVPKIVMVWGCVGKDTEILMANMTIKKVSEIVVGDFVYTEDNELRKVTNISYGNQEVAVCVKTESGMEVLLSDSHVVCAEFGDKSASDLSIGDKLITLNGLEKIRSISYEEYNDDMYNLGFEATSKFYANGILVGDMNMEQNYIKPKSESQVEYSDEVKTVLTELSGLFSAIRKQEG